MQYYEIVQQMNIDRNPTVLDHGNKLLEELTDQTNNSSLTIVGLQDFLSHGAKIDKLLYDHRKFQKQFDQCSGIDDLVECS